MLADFTGLIRANFWFGRTVHSGPPDAQSTTGRLDASRGLVHSGKVKGFACQTTNLQIRNLIDTWCRATEAGDVDALTPLMTDDIVFLTPGREPFGKRGFWKARGNRRAR